MIVSPFKQSVARIISQALDPTVMLPFMVVLMLFGTSLTSPQLDALVLPVLLIELIIPIGLLLVFYKMGWVSDWEITKREERRTFFIAIVALHILSVLAFYKWGSELSAQLRLAIWIVQFLGMIVTFYWKVSIHTAAFGGTIFVFGYLFGMEYWVLLLLAPLLMWSRVVREKHTWAQAIVGFFGTITVLAAVLWILV